MNEVNFLITPATLIILGAIGYYLHRKIKAMDSELHDISLQEQDIDNAKLVYNLADNLGLVEGYYPNNLDSKILLFHKPNAILPFSAKNVELRENNIVGGYNNSQFTICEVCNKQGDVLALLAVSMKVWAMYNPSQPNRGYKMTDFIYPKLIMRQDEKNQD